MDRKTIVQRRGIDARGPIGDLVQRPEHAADGPVQGENGADGQSGRHDQQ